MTKDEMTTLLRGVGVNENTVTAMTNAYEMGFEQGAALSPVAMELIEEARDVLNLVDNEEVANTDKFWELFHKMKGLA
jgi:hypothetical protein